MNPPHKISSRFQKAGDFEKYHEFLSSRLMDLKRRPISERYHTQWIKHDLLRFCLKEEPIQEGLILEFGVYKGHTIRMISNAFPERAVYGFDSFEGFPDDGRTDWRCDFSLGGVQPEVPGNIHLIKGFFDQTLPEFMKRQPTEFISFMHIDCDLYSSTRTILEHCGPRIGNGTVIVFDELLHYKDFMENEMLAFYEFVQREGIHFEWIGTRGDVMPVEQFLRQYEQLPSSFVEWRKMGYDQGAALRIVG